MLQQGIEQRNEFGRKRKLAVLGLPAGGEHEQFALAHGGFDQRRVAVVELREDPCAGDFGGVEPAMFPKVNLGEVAETRIGKWREERMAEINLAEHRIATAGRFTRRQSLDFQYAAEGKRHRGRPQQDQHGFALLFQPAAHGWPACLRQRVGDDQQRRVFHVGWQQHRVRTAGDHLRDLPSGFLESALEKIERLRGVLLRVVSKKQNVHPRRLRRNDKYGVVEFIVIAPQDQTVHGRAGWRRRRGHHAALPRRHIDIHRRAGKTFPVGQRPADLELLFLRVGSVAHPDADLRFRRFLSGVLGFGHELQTGVGTPLHFDRLDHQFDVPGPFVRLQGVELAAFLQIAD